MWFRIRPASVIRNVLYDVPAHAQRLADLLWRMGFQHLVDSAGCGEVNFRVDATPAVFRIRDWLQMCRIHAATISAEVIQLHAIGHRADKLLIHPAMRLDGLAIVGNAVPLAAWSASPIPAFGIGVDGVGIGSLVVTADVPHRLPLHHSERASGLAGNRGRLAASTKAKARGVGGQNTARLRAWHVDLPTGRGVTVPAGVGSTAPALSCLNYTGFTGRMA